MRPSVSRVRYSRGRLTPRHDEFLETLDRTDELTARKMGSVKSTMKKMDSTEQDMLEETEKSRVLCMA